MTFQYEHRIPFPDTELATEEGFLTQGGDLTPVMLLSAYSQGIFPWFNPCDPILWWSPDPRMVLFLEDFKISKSLKQTIRSKKYDCRFNENFEQVIHKCASVSRPGQAGTWITKEIKAAYLALHQMGFAHSVETYFEGKLVGGLYGLTMFPFFFGESMFHSMPDASKVALYYLIKQLKEKNYLFVDVQQSTKHLKSLGAKDISRNEFEASLKKEFEKSPQIKSGI